METLITKKYFRQLCGEISAFEVYEQFDRTVSLNISPFEDQTTGKISRCIGKSHLPSGNSSVSCCHHFFQ